VRAVAILVCATALALAWNTAMMRKQVAGEVTKSQPAENAKENHLALKTSQMIAGLQLPAGTVIKWKNEEHKEAEIELPGPSEISGTPLAGHLSLSTYFWNGRLWRNRVLNGWPCAKGNVMLETNGKLFECTLSSSRVFPTVTIRGGSRIDLTTNNENDVPFAETRWLSPLTRS
jgi:hypothetical protein